MQGREGFKPVTKKKKPPKHVLLIWNAFEDFDLFLIPLEDCTAEQRNFLRRVHGNMINAGSTTFNGDFTEEQIDEALSMVNELIADPNAEWLTKERSADYFEKQAESFSMSLDDFKALYGNWHQYRLDSAKPQSIPRARVVQSGFIP